MLRCWHLCPGLNGEDFWHEGKSMIAGWLSAVDGVRTWQRDFVAAEAQATPPAPVWSSGRFARDQIRGLVRQVFSLTGVRPMRQIVFSAIDLESEIDGICRRVGETLAQERGRE